MADDDDEDQDLTRDALQHGQVAADLRFVSDGRELLEYLRLEGRYVGRPSAAPRPGIILLDLNMPKMDGREALVELKADESLRRIPVVVFTTSSDEQDVLRSYDLGVNSFITKPVTFGGLVDVMASWRHYWFDLVELPSS